MADPFDPLEMPQRRQTVESSVMTDSGLPRRSARRGTLARLGGRAGIGGVGRAGAIGALAWLTAAGGLLSATAPAPYVDRTEAWGLDFVHYNGMTGELYFVEPMVGGVALLDYDGDGDLDVYLTQGQLLGPEKKIEQSTFPPRYPPPLTDRLYRNDLVSGADGEPTPRFVDVTAASGRLGTGYGVGVAAADWNNDGWVDLYVSNFGANEMLENNGDGTFSDVTGTSGTGAREWSFSASFFDYDRDGWLDLYVTNYVDYRLAIDKPCSSSTGARDYCGPASYSPVADTFYRNRGDGTFEDVSKASGIAASEGTGLGVVSGDFNGDGWLDLYVTNDQLPNFLWINQGDGTFRDESLLGGCAVNAAGQPEASMGVLAADFDGDGSEDLFMSHLFRETNTLYLNDGRGLFLDETRSSGLGAPSFRFTGFGTGLVDYDLDGDLDIFVVNGEVKRIEELMRAGDPYPLHQTNQLFRNEGAARFVEVSDPAAEVFSLSEVSRGLAAGDLDLDGDEDLVVFNNSGPARVHENVAGDGGSWLGLEPFAAGLGRHALAARVGLTASGGSTLWRRARTDGSYASAGDPRVRFGLGGRREAGRLRIEWPYGGVTELARPPAGRYLTLTGGATP